MEGKRHNYNRTGWGFILLSVLCVFVFLADYKTQFIFHLTSISELGTILGGTSGIFASLASLFFVLENLEMQRRTIEQQQESIDQQKQSIDLQAQELKNQIQEMKESNEYFKQQTETLKIQTSESAYFQLLDNHRNLVNSLTFGDLNGYAGLTRYYKSLKTETASFKKAAIDGIIYKSDGGYYPLRLLQFQIENIEQLYENIYHLVKLIQLKLADSLFYHEVFYNSLSKAEKYILGLYCFNVKSSQVEIFKNKTFNYLTFFENSGESFYTKDSVPFFPNLSFTFIKPWGKFYFLNYMQGNLDQENGKVKLGILHNEEKFEPLLKLIRYTYSWKPQPVSLDQECNQPIDGNSTIQTFDFINEHIFPKYIEYARANPTSFRNYNFSFGIEYVCDYNGMEFSYIRYYAFKTANESETGADFHIEAN